MSSKPSRTISELKASEWRQIVDSATDTAIISTDREGRVTSWNVGAFRLLGWTEAEMLGQTLERLFTEEDRTRGMFSQEMADAISLGRGGGAEGWRIRKDGSRFWAIGELSPIRNDGNELAGFIKIVRDRTSQRQAEIELNEERRTLEILNRAGSSLASETDLQRLVQIVTDAGVELCGAEFGAFFYNVLNQDGEAYMLYTLSGAPLEAFSKFPMPRNTAVFAPTFTGEGIVRSDDITKDPRYGKNAPRKGMPEGHLPVRSYLAVPVVSRGGDVLGGLFFGHASPGIFSQRSEQGLAALAAEAAVAIENFRLTSALQIELEQRKKAQQALSELNQNLEKEVIERTHRLEESEQALRQSQKLEAIGQLTGGVAHDFNNLLQIIIGNLEILKRISDASSGRIQRAIENALKGANRAAALTQRLLAFARRQPLNPQPIDVNVLVNGMHDLLRRTLSEAISIEVVGGAGLWMIEVDPNEMEAAILNLAVNARDAMAQGGRLTLETANAHIDETYAKNHTEVIPGQYVSISISDTGTGMDAVTIERAFEPFFTTKEAGKGTGLGLSQVYGFVKQSGGHVKLYSEPGHGTTVKIYLPRWKGNPDSAMAEPSLPVPEGDHNETILVVEDDEGVRTYSVECLQELGYRVFEAADGPTALRLLKELPHVDLLFTDVVLPNEMTGAQLAAQAAAIKPGLRVLFTTGYARNAIIHHGRLDKGVHLLTKPFTHADLASKIRDLLDRAIPDR